MLENHCMSTRKLIQAYIHLTWRKVEKFSVNMLNFEDVTYALSMTLHVVEPLLLLYKSVVLMSCCVHAPF